MFFKFCALDRLLPTSEFACVWNIFSTHYVLSSLGHEFLSIWILCAFCYLIFHLLARRVLQIGDYLKSFTTTVQAGLILIYYRKFPCSSLLREVLQGIKYNCSINNLQLHKSCICIFSFVFLVHIAMCYLAFQ